MIFPELPRIVANLKRMNEPIHIEVFGHAADEICSGCDGHDCGDCAPGVKKPTIELVEEFGALLAASELAGAYALSFHEATPENIRLIPDVERLLSMAKLEPVVCVDGKIAYLGGFSPEGLLEELRKKRQG